MRKKLPSRMSGAISVPVSVARALAFVFVLLLSVSAGAQLQLLKDINTAEEQSYSEYSQLTHGVGRMYYVSNNELWKSSGTTESTIRLKAFVSISNLTMVGNTLYFSADDGVSGVELWKSTGTPGGTVRVKDIMPGATGSSPANLINVNGVLFFAAYVNVGGTELWKSDGTSNGTVRVKDIARGSSNPRNMANVNGTLYFCATNDVNGYELWKSNGSEAGTVQVLDINPGKLSSDPQWLTSFNGKLYFSAYDASNGRELWTSDGTAAGTTRVKDIRLGAQSSTPENLTVINNEIIFTAHDGVHGDELWKTNGAGEGTVLVKDMNPGGYGSNANVAPMRDFTNINGVLYFMAGKGDEEHIYRTDGTAAGTVMIQKTAGFNGAPAQPEFTYMRGYVYFFTPSSWEDQYLMRMPYNGTRAQASVVREFGMPFTWVDDVPPLRNEMLTYYDKLYFFARFSFNDNMYGGFEFIKSDGTAEGTVSVHDTFIPTLESRPREMIKAGNIVYMNQYSEISYTPELYRTDGTPAGTYELMPGRYFSDWAVAGNEVYMVTDNFNEGGWPQRWEIWKSAGTRETTRRVVSGGDFDGPTMPAKITTIGNYLYYTNSLGELWRTDGVSGPPQHLGTFSSVIYMRDLGTGGVIMTRNNDVLELYRATASGLSPIHYFWTSVADGHTVMVGNIMYFPILVEGRACIFRTDGTAPGTYRVTEDVNSPAYGDWDQGLLSDMIAFGNQLYFVGENKSTGGHSLFKLEGSAVVTIADVPEAIRHVVINGKMVLFTTDYVTTSVYTSDGTPEGTKLSATIDGPGYPSWLDHAVVGDQVYFNVLFNKIMWRSDGTQCGTYPVEIGANNIFALEAIGNNLIFGGYMLATGVEPYVYRNINSVTGAPPCTETPSFAATESSTQYERQNMSYPNPFSSTFTLRIESDVDEAASVSVFTIYGMPVETISDLRTNTSYDLGTSWPKGTYILKAQTASKVVTQQVMKN